MAAMTYKEGSKGAVVKQIQKVVGCYPDGVWGKITTECLKAWQKAHGLTADGIAGPRTLAVMGLSAAVQGLKIQGAGQSINRIGITLRKSKRRIDYIVVHCTATPEGQDLTVEQIRRQHKQQGWSDIGYHYIIYRDGTVHEGRNVDIAGAHVAGYNSHSIGIAYVGGLEPSTCAPYHLLQPRDTRTEEQRAALYSLLMDLRKFYPKAVIQGHRDFSPDKDGDGLVEPHEWIKACPSFDAKTAYRKI